MPASYVPLWCKSNYSFLEGASHPAELVDTAHAGQLPALALTDRHGVYGVVRAYEQAKALGLRLVVGAQVTIDPHSTLVLLAKNREGYAQLCTLLTLGHQDQPKGEFRLSLSQIAEGSADLVALWRPETLGAPQEQSLATLTDIFPNRLYAMVSRHLWIHDALRERETLDLARRFAIPPVAVTEVLYHHPDRQELHDLLTCIRHKVRLTDAGTRLKPNAEHALLSAPEFLSRYADRPEWVNRTRDIAEECRFSMAEIEYRYPVEGVPEGYSTAQWLKFLVTQGMILRYEKGVPEAVRIQLDKELALIEELQYCGYFLTMYEIVEYCRQNQILCQGRGSAANSAVCYCLGITAIDPVAMNLLFERFLSKERAEPPDIDLDIEHERREEVIQHMYHRYGRHRAAMVANVVRYRHRSALREVGKVLGISEVDLDRSSKMVSHNDEGIVGAVTDAGLDMTRSVHQTLLRLSRQLQNFPRHLSIHPGGFLLGSEALSRIVPVENATMPGRTVIQWDKTDVETMNLFKVDLLGLGALTQLDYAFRLLKKHQIRKLTMATIPADDTETYDLICRADTIGVFQIESRAQMSMLPRLKPRNYYDLVVEVSLVRPGPISGGMVHPYLRRRSGLEPITYPHERLKPVLEKTLGIPLFQEQVMKLAMVAADYTPGEADQLRRDMAAWKQTGRIDQHRERLISRMVANGIAQEFAERVFEQIRGFGEYGFPESHAASFALIAYATAYLKCHHPDVFTCALLNAWPMGFYSPATIIGDAKRHGVPILPVDLLHSDWDYTLEPASGTRLAVRIGLRAVEGLHRVDADQLLNLRRGGAPPRLADWKTRSRVSIDTWEKLAVSGALDSFGDHRRDALWQVLDQAKPLALGLDTETVASFLAPNKAEVVAWDYDSTGLSPRAHLLQELRPQLRAAGYAAAVEVGAMEPAQGVRCAGLVICRQRPGNAHGVLFMTLEDETGMVNVVVWKPVWDRYRKTILTSSFLGIAGTLQAQDGVVHLIARRLWVPEGILTAQELIPPSHDFR